MLKQRIESLDLLRGLVMIVMALDHVRDYFHGDAFLYSPTDLTKTSVALFFTRWVTHFCAPVFVFLAGISACLYGAKKGPKALSFFLLTRGCWLIFVEVFGINLLRTFNLSFPFINLQVIWAIGISMIVLSALIHLDRTILLVIGVVLVAGHNLLDYVNLPVLESPGAYIFGPFKVVVKYPALPWIGIMIIGYCTGRYYLPGFATRKPMLIMMGFSAISIFIILRGINLYGDPSPWSRQSSELYTILSYLNVTKYPPSLLYTLMTLGPALLYLALSEKPLNKWKERITVFGRTAMFYYLAHILLIHLLAVIAAVVSGHKASDMILTGAVNEQPALKGYGFSLFVVYLVWIGVLLILYPICKRYDRYKRAHQMSKWWLSYL
jgi:uncharacterized membrane protein